MSKRTCNGTCKKFRVKKPPVGGRYESGQGRCQICDVWIDFRGCHLKDGSPAGKESSGWFCNCCNYRIRRNPRHSKYKERLRSDVRAGRDTSSSKPDELIEKTLDLIKSSPNGAYLGDLVMLLGISHEEMSDAVARLIRMDVITREEIWNDVRSPDILLKYKTGENHEYVDMQAPDVGPARNGKHDGNQTEDVADLAGRMVHQHVENKTRITKPLQKRLTKEFVEHGWTINDAIREHPELTENDVRRHVRTSLRLPPKLRELEIEGALHPNPDCSLQIALFATDHYEWGGGKEREDDVVRLAQAMSIYVTKDSAMDQKFSGKARSHKTAVRHSVTKGRGVSAATAIWIATATLHKHYGTDSDFSARSIIQKVADQGLCKNSVKTIETHVSMHCVANIRPCPNKLRTLYRVSRGRYRLYRRGDYCDPARRSGRIKPMIRDIPDEYRDLAGWYDRQHSQV